MSDEGDLLLLLLGPGAGASLYWMLYRFYRNTDKSHAFEKETHVVAKPMTGSDEKVGQVTGVRNAFISGNNKSDWRKRVERMQ
jgi:hypothetical protein